MSEDNPWRPGDLVQLKSGGPCMTVAGEDTLGRVICEWFDGKIRNSDTFNHAVLKKYEAPRSSFTVSRA